MAESEQVIHLTGKEDIHAIRTMLARAQAKRLMLVVPEGHAALKRLVRVKMLARQAYDEGLQLALVSRDARIRDLAGEMDLSAFRSVEAGRRARRWRSGEGAVASTAGTPAPARPHNLTWERGRGAVLERRQQLGTQSNWAESVMLAGLIFGMMIILSAVLVLLVPSATITLVPRQVTLNETFAVTVDASAREIDLGDELVPAQTIQQDVRGTLEMATTGRSDVPAERARGSVIFINITGQPVTVPAGTLVSTSSGAPVRFRTTETVSLPDQINARATAPIEAVSPGPVGNVGPGQINRVEGAAATAVRVLNEGALEGGTVQQRAVVTAADREQLRQQLEQLLLQQGRQALETMTEERNAEQASDEASGPAQYLVSDLVAMEIVAENFNGSVEDQIDVLRLEMNVRMTGLLVASRDLQTLARRRMEAQVPSDFRMMSEGFTVTPGEAQVVDGGLPTIAVRTEALAIADLRRADNIQRLVRGQPLDEAQALLLQRLPLEADPSISVSPDWWSRLPYLPVRIFVRVGELGVEQVPIEVAPGEGVGP